MRIRKLLLFLSAAIFLLACGCDTDKAYKAKGNTPGEKFASITNDVGNMNLDGPAKELNTKIFDQISRVNNGMHNGSITDSEIEEIIASLETLFTKITSMQEEMKNGPGSKGQNGPSGGMGGPPSGGMGGPPSGGMGGPPSGGMEGSASGGGKTMDFPEFKQLRTLIDILYSNTVTASAVPLQEEIQETK